MIDDTLLIFVYLYHKELLTHKSKTDSFNIRHRLKMTAIRVYPELIPFTFHPLNLLFLCPS